MKLKQSILPILLAVGMISCVPLGMSAIRECEARQDAAIALSRELIANDGCILHAGGFINDENGEQYKYTNSIEAMENALVCGDRMIEIDVVQTSDGEMVCLHKWKNLQKPNGKKYKKAMTFKQFRGGTVKGHFTPMAVVDLAAYMRENPDLYIILDVKTPKRWVYSKIAAYYPDLLDRLIAQIYHLSDYELIHGMGFDNIILTLYDADPDELQPEKLKAFASEKKLVGITMPVRFTKPEYETVYNTLKETALPLYVHTIDGAQNRQMRLDEGFSAVYTNDVRNNR